MLSISAMTEPPAFSYVERAPSMTGPVRSCNLSALSFGETWRRSKARVRDLDGGVEPARLELNGRPWRWHRIIDDDGHSLECRQHPCVFRQRERDLEPDPFLCAWPSGRYHNEIVSTCLSPCGHIMCHYFELPFDLVGRDLA